MSTEAKWVPVVSSEAGLTLTSLNWQEAGVDTVVYYLESLLIKPGLNLLNKITSFSEYIDNSQAMILNASRLKANKEGVITLASPYDGSKLSLTVTEMVALINQLKPLCAILPENIVHDYPDIWQNLNSQIKAFICFEELGSNFPRGQGIYFKINQSIELPNLDLYKNYDIYVQGSLDLKGIRSLKSLGINYIESDRPARQGLEGLVYNGDEVIDIKNESYTFDFDPICKKCHCPGCATQLTRAYFHHLYFQTPLLCQRLLIQHNAWMVGFQPTL